MNFTNIKCLRIKLLVICNFQTNVLLLRMNIFPQNYMKPLCDTIVMIRPVHFDFNVQTAESNSFQDASLRTQAEETQALALAEFNAFAKKLDDENIHVICYNDSPEPHTPDSIFPNNWISFHEDKRGTVILYPMFAPNRRQERRLDIIDSLQKTYGYPINNVIDLTHYEEQNLFLEGTGSLILDRVRRIAYSCVSPRADRKMLEIWGEMMQYEMCIFEALDKQNQAIYHTNVVMCLGAYFVVICLDCIPTQYHEMLLTHFKDTKKEVITISYQQVENFAGNMLNMYTWSDESVVIMSERAYKSLNPEQITRISYHARIIHSPLTTIENNGGGSARCMMAEMFVDHFTGRIFG